MLDNRLVAPYFPISYYLGMEKNSFKDRIAAAMAEQGLSVAELSRRSKVPTRLISSLKETGQLGPIMP